MAITGIEEADGEYWHLLDDPAVELAGAVTVRIDAERRSLVSQLHTDSHILNALVFERFPGTLVTGAQINADGTGRMDFDLIARSTTTSSAVSTSPSTTSSAARSRSTASMSTPPEARPAKGSYAASPWRRRRRLMVS